MYILTCICAYVSYSKAKVLPSIGSILDVDLPTSFIRNSLSHFSFAMVANAMCTVASRTLLIVRGNLDYKYSPRHNQNDWFIATHAESNARAVRLASGLEVSFDRLDAIGDLVSKIKVESFRCNHVSNSCQEYFKCRRPIVIHMESQVTGA